MPTYHIILLPEARQREKLNKLKNRLYIGGYRYAKEPSSSDVHMTLTQISFGKIGLMEKIKNAITKIAKQHSPFSLPYLEITDKIQKDSKNIELKKQYPHGRGWISLLFENKNNELGSITKELIEIAKGLDIDDMNSYIDRIKTIKPKGKRTNNILDYTANHMNICNYALPEKTREAKSIIQKGIPLTITFDTLAIRNQEGKHEFEIKLTN